MVSNVVSLNASTYGNLFISGTGSLAVPVSPSAVIYTQFNHIQGIAARSGQEGIPVSRLKILNTLIEQLVRMNKNNVISKEQAAKLDEETQDDLIKIYQQKLQESLAKASQPNTYGFAGNMPQPGDMFSFTA